MANQVVAAQMIPRLGVPGLASPPSGRLPSHLDLLRLLHHQQHYNLVGFQGMGKICCKIEGKTHKARCQEGNDLMVPWDECRTGCYVVFFRVLMNETAWREQGVRVAVALRLSLRQVPNIYFLNAHNFATKSPS